MKHLTRFLFLFAGISLVAYAAVDWEARYVDLCKYDGMCGKLKNGSNGWTPPEADVVDVLRTSRPLIQAAAKLYGVDPRAIAGCILTENSLNLRMKHEAEKWVAKFMQGSEHSIFGKRFGSGIGQLHDDIALDVEPRAAAMEKRPQLKSMIEVHQRMQSIEGSIYYIAAILKDAQDIYRKYGFDITKDIGLQTTLYNLGQYDRRAQDSKTNNRQPRINHFGFFVLRNEPLLASIVGMNDDNTTPSEPVTAAETKSRGKEIKKSTTVLTDNVDLTNLPDLCDQSAAKGKISTLNKDIPFKVNSKDVDCNLDQWNLVAGDNGATGWVKTSILKAKSTQSTSYESCAITKDDPCIQSIKATGKSRVAEGKNGLTLSLNKITDCNDDTDDSSEDTLTFSDRLTPAEASDIAAKISQWYSDAYTKSLPAGLIQTVSSGVSQQNGSWTSAGRYYEVFIKKADYQTLLAFFSKPVDTKMTQKEADDIKSLLSKSAFASSSSVDYILNQQGLNACDSMPQDYQESWKLLNQFKFKTIVDNQQTYGTYSNLSGFQSFCQTEFAQQSQPQSTASASPTPSPSTSSSASPSSQVQAQNMCTPSTDPSSGLKSNLRGIEQVCAKLAAADAGVAKRMKALFKNYSNVAQVRECGYDLKDATKMLKALTATGCVKQVYVDSAPAFEFLAAQKVKTIYRPMKTDGQFMIEPKAKNSCDKNGNSK